MIETAIEAVFTQINFVEDYAAYAMENADVFQEVAFLQSRLEGLAQDLNQLESQVAQLKTPSILDTTNLSAGEVNELQREIHKVEQKVVRAYNEMVAAERYFQLAPDDESLGRRIEAFEQSKGAERAMSTYRDALGRYQTLVNKVASAKASLA